MRVAALALLLAVGTVPAAAQEQRAPVPLDHLPALAGDYFHLPWPEQDRGFHIYVRLPADYGERPGHLYPIVYLLDGDSLFPILAANHLFLTYDEGLPEAIVVGIAYGGFGAVNRRGTDFTPPMPDGDPEGGGAPAFHAFLKERLLPQVERRYRADPARRILVGQSLGGTFVLYSAFTDPHLFWNRIASNPAIERYRPHFYGRPDRGVRNDTSLFVASGSRDRPDLRAEALRWWASWRDREDRPLTMRFETIEGGTHAANITDAYRAGLLAAFGSDE